MASRVRWIPHTQNREMHVSVILSSILLPFALLARLVERR